MTTSALSLDDLIAIAKARTALRDGTARRVRQHRNLTLREVAQVAQITPATLSRWESGKRVPRGEALLRYARILGW